MSADNWVKCPRCFDKLIKKNEELKQKLKDEYGKIPVEKWEDLLQESKKPIQTEKAISLREDYGIGMDEHGTFSVGYTCLCDQCDFTYNYKFDTEVEF